MIINMTYHSQCVNLNKVSIFVGNSSALLLLLFYTYIYLLHFIQNSQFGMKHAAPLLSDNERARRECIVNESDCL